ncbi:hypothetical protein NNJEOMEG_03716 [Fundidesulfovibrio magnetotacticus]|uniref:Cupin type-2 domain-containing protein n=1 Tax=Fundidesulfovibrio magnetotacticus TaxID=2730080 RepID=A0A6V8LVS5_9BACT|nr:cupin domain-containing protein [Fundidesulfovibrio magnetotacticus]GFK95844.1 hypothetical protein NNJEOMEG_03716 [Fundidesulfovibrio magnetotacticus]
MPGEHLNWDDLEWDIPARGVRRKVVHGAGYTLALVELSPDDSPALHAHPHEQASTVQNGHGVFIVDGRRHPVRSGDVVRIASNVPHALAVPGPGVVTVLDVFVPRREEFPESKRKA